MTDEDIIGFLKVVEYLSSTSPNDGKVFIEVKYPIDNIGGLIEFYSSSDKRPTNPISGCCVIAEQLSAYSSGEGPGSLHNHVEDFKKTVKLFQEGFHGAQEDYNK